MANRNIEEIETVILTPPGVARFFGVQEGYEYCTKDSLSSDDIINLLVRL